MADALSMPISQWQGRLVNDFETAVAAQLPEVAAIKRRLIAMGAAYASMSGSGSAVYGLFDRDILAEEVGREFPSSHTYVGCLD